MACTANIVYNSVCDESHSWIQAQLKNTTDRAGLALCVNRKHRVIPLRIVEKVFDKSGYGKDKSNKWLTRWKYLDYIDWINLTSSERYVILKDLPLSKVEIKEIIAAIDEAKRKEEQDKLEKQRKFDAIKAEGERKEAARSGVSA